MTTNYRKGYSFERRVRKHYEKDGFWVIRAGGSKGKADLVALKKDDRPYLIQCKSSGIIPKHERVELARLASHLDAVAVVAKRKGRKLILETLIGER